MNVLLAEDDLYKRDRVAALIQEELPRALLICRGSVTSGACELQAGHIDIALIDMSLPTYDLSPTESGGKPQGFGGVELLRVIDAMSPRTRAIVVTQFERFESAGALVDLPALRTRLARDFPSIFGGLVFYQHAGDEWRNPLRDLIRKASRGWPE